MRAQELPFVNKDRMANLLQNPIVLAHLASGDVAYSNFSLTESNTQMLSSIFALLQEPLSGYTETRQPMHFFMANTLEGPRVYLTSLLTMANVYAEIAKDLNDYSQYLNLVILLTATGFVLMSFIGIATVYLRIRKSKLHVMSFFIQIPTRGLDEILDNCDGFLSALTQTEVDTVVESDSYRQGGSHTDNETGSSVSQSQDIIYKGYHKHQPRHMRMLSDTLSAICCTVFKYFTQFLLVEIFFIICFVVSQHFGGLLSEAGNQAIQTSQLELDTSYLLTLLKESIAADTRSPQLSPFYLKFNNVMNKSIEMIKTLEDVREPLHTIDVGLQEH